MSVTITGRIMQTAPGSEPGKMGVYVKWRISQPMVSASEGEDFFEFSQELTDQEIESSVRVQLAARVSELAETTFTESDVRGCRF